MTDDAKRAHLVRLAESTRKRAKLPTGFHIVVVVTDANGDWCGVSSSADDYYTGRLLTSAISGADFQRHSNKPIDTTLAPSRSRRRSNP